MEQYKISKYWLIFRIINFLKILFWRIFEFIFQFIVFNLIWIIIFIVTILATCYRLFQTKGLNGDYGISKGYTKEEFRDLKDRISNMFDYI